MIHKIENVTKVEAILTTIVVSLLGLVYQHTLTEEPISPYVIQLIIIFLAVLILFQLLYYLKFIIEKMMYIKEQTSISTMKTQEIDKECKKLELQVQLKKLETG